ncbi:prolyl oligopeptidase family serine peptidase [Arthrobacter rhombi]|uniref:prolyl oligopeptidase family serine peptidase n=1 Tax=Arthrobacter rhombi TaxID=71253 RepID=UPI003FD37CD9
MDSTSAAPLTGPTTDSDPDDSFSWLEDIHGAAAVDWVRKRNAATEDMLHDEAYRSLESSVLSVLDAQDRIPMATKRGRYYYNFWRDASHPKGLWRRTTWQSYASEDPDWQILLDVDALAAAEGTDWVFAGAALLRPQEGGDYLRALLRLSPDGGDAVAVREFDLQAARFVPDGFSLPAGKSQVSWDGPDAWYVATDFGPGSLTRSGYARTVRRVHRGMDPGQAPEVFAVEASHVMAQVSVDQTPGYRHVTATDVVDFFNTSTSILREGQWVPVEVPTHVRVGLHRQWLMFSPQQEWELGTRTLPSGCLAVADLDAFLSGERTVTVVFTPDADTSLQSSSFTADHLLLTVLHHVSSRILVADPADGWQVRRLEVGGEEHQDLSIGPVDDEDPETANDFWLVSTGFLSPATLSRGTIGAGAPQPIKSSPARFDATGLEVQQHFATSDDGTAVPYFQVGPKDLALDGANPVLMNGYGGFETSLTPSYSGVVGRAWLRRESTSGRDGVYVLTNIRGGGEYGPAWHRAALRENRPRAYEDFAAIARDLVHRGVTRPEHLAATGRSNGGLLVGNMLTVYPELFGAISCGVPLLDMRRYTRLSAGHSWIAEYGDPDVAKDWEFIAGFSPYHLLDAALAAGKTFPTTLFWSATSDDRVGPVQARKMAAKMLDAQVPGIWYRESLEGGHAGASDNRQSAQMLATSYEFLWRAVS